MGKRISGLQSTYDKKQDEIKKLLESRDDAANDGGDGDKGPYAQTTAKDRSLRAREDKIREAEAVLTRKTIAAEMGVEEDNVTGDNETEMRLAAIMYLWKNPQKKDDEGATAKAETKTNVNPASNKGTGSTVSREGMSGLDMISKGMAANPKSIRPGSPGE